MATELVAKEPKKEDKVYKDECAFCFNAPSHPGGLFICLSKYVGLCVMHLPEYADRYGAKAFLNIRRVVEEDKEGAQKEPELEIQGLKMDIKPLHYDSFAVYIAPDLSTAVPITEAVGSELYKICNAVIQHPSASVQEQIEKGVSDSDGELVLETRLSEDLVQLRVDKTILYEDWQCEWAGCQADENLWMNLSDGKILCGRYGESQASSPPSPTLMWDCATASFSIVYGNPASGRAHSEQHARETGFPLVVKLGTIEADGTAEVYQYEFNSKGEDIGNTVKDTRLREHLAHFGLDMDKFRKREKTTLELDLNNNFEYKVCQEEGVNLESAYGPGLTGLVNLGFSCYINSVMQMLVTVPDFVKAYSDASKALFQSMDPAKGQEQLCWQMGKLISGMMSGDYSVSGSNSNGITAKQFRRVMGRGHVEFSTAKQQDVEEFVRHLFKKIDESPPDEVDPVFPFRFHTVERLEDVASGKVRYSASSSDEVILALHVPMECAKEVETEREDADEEEDDDDEVEGEEEDDDEEEEDDDEEEEDDAPKTRKEVHFSECLSKTFAETAIEGYVSPVTGEAKGAKQTVRMGSFPKFLIVQIKRFVLDGTETKKLSIFLHVDDEIDLEAFRSHGLQPNDEEWPDSAQSTRPNSDAEESAVLQLVGLGFSKHQAVYSLKQHNNNLNIAAEWLVENAHEIPEEGQVVAGLAERRHYSDGKSRYRLRGFITHMGKATSRGHYVAHIEKGGVWYIFNDEKVAISQRPPRGYGYLYLYERVD